MCEMTIAVHSTDLCPHPSITVCSDCRVELCSAHLLECEECNHFLCRDCIAEHIREHQRYEQALRRGV